MDSGSVGSEFSSPVEKVSQQGKVLLSLSILLAYIGSQADSGIRELAAEEVEFTKLASSAYESSSKRDLREHIDDAEFYITEQEVAKATFDYRNENSLLVQEFSRALGQRAKFLRPCYWDTYCEASESMWFHGVELPDFSETFVGSFDEWRAVLGELKFHIERIVDISLALPVPTNLPDGLQRIVKVEILRWPSPTDGRKFGRLKGTFETSELNMRSNGRWSYGRVDIEFDFAVQPARVSSKKSWFHRFPQMSHYWDDIGRLRSSAVFEDHKEFETVAHDLRTKSVPDVKVGEIGIRHQDIGYGLSLAIFVMQVALWLHLENLRHLLNGRTIAVPTWIPVMSRESGTSVGGRDYRPDAIRIWSWCTLLLVPVTAVGLGLWRLTGLHVGVIVGIAVVILAVGLQCGRLASKIASGLSQRGSSGPEK